MPKIKTEKTNSRPLFTVLCMAVVAANLKVLLKDISHMTFTDTIERGRGRLDCLLDPFLAYLSRNDSKKTFRNSDRLRNKDAKKRAEIQRIVDNIRSSAECVVQTMKGVESIGLTGPYTVYASLLQVASGACAQEFHQDCAVSKAASKTYWTVLVPLTSHKNQGGTEFAESELAARELTDLTMPKCEALKQGYCFDGQTYHRGTKNCSGMTRIALQLVVIKGKREDPNRPKGVQVPLISSQ